MRYADGGGLTAKARQRRETVRLEAAALFDEGVPPKSNAGDLWIGSGRNAEGVPSRMIL
jgi:hypothetical protein